MADSVNSVINEALQPARELFDKWAREGTDIELEESHRHAVREALRDVSVPEAASILDAGCGNGYVVRALAKRLPKATVMGVDISGEMITNARDLTPDDLFNAVFYSGTIFDEAMGDEKFDLIFSAESIYYMIPVEDAVKRLASLLKPGGQLLIVTDYYEENKASHGWPRKYDVPMQLMSAADYIRVLMEAGLENPIQQYIRYPEGQDVPKWKFELGSLATSAVKPYELTADEIIREAEQTN